MNLRTEVDRLMDLNQALKAWDLVKDIDDPLKERVRLKVRHAFDPEEYRKFYQDNSEERPIRDEFVYDCTKIGEPRLKWVVDNILQKKQSPVVDLGCADGFVSLTLARYGIECTGVNLYKPSVDLANKRAWENNLPAKFICQDLFEHEGSYQAVILMEVLEHIPNPGVAIKKAYELCEVGGSVYLSTPRTDHVGIEEHLKEEGRTGWDDGKPSGHLQLFAEEELKQLLGGYYVEQFIVDATRNMCVEIIKDDHRF